MAGGDPSAQLQVVRVHAIAVEGAARLFFDGEPDIPAEVEALTLEVMAPGREQLAESAHCLLANELSGRHVREVP